MLTRSYRPSAPVYVPQGLRGKSIFGWCHAQCDIAEEIGAHRFRLDPHGPVEWEHVLLIARKRGLAIASSEDGEIRLNVQI